MANKFLLLYLRYEANSFLESNSECFCRFNDCSSKTFKLQLFIRICSNGKKPLSVYGWIKTEAFLFYAQLYVFPKKHGEETKNSLPSPRNNTVRPITLPFSLGITHLPPALPSVSGHWAPIPRAWCDRDTPSIVSQVQGQMYIILKMLAVLWW